MIEKMSTAVVLVDRVLRALEESTEGTQVNPLTFFQHPALDGWLPEAKDLIKHIEGKTMKDYPAEFDEEKLDNTYFTKAFPDAESPSDLARQVYKYTTCGAHLSVQIQYNKTIEPDGFEDFPSDQLVTEWVQGEDLSRFDSWADMDSQGVLMTALMVGSIVEGVDHGTDEIEIEAKQLDEEPEEFRKRFDEALAKVEEEAQSIWNDTHGCTTCAEHLGIDLDEEMSPIWIDCPDCQGAGAVI